jgi:LysM repeat protein
MSPESLIAAAKTFLGRPWRYSKADCVTLLKDTYSKIGLSYPTSNGVRPYTVSYVENYFSGTKYGATRVPTMGNILIWNDANGKPAHTGFAIDATHAISALPTGVGIHHINIWGTKYPLAHVLVDPRITTAVVVVPPTPPTPPDVNYYIAQAGDSWIKIAKKFGFSWFRLLMRLNPGKLTISPGDQIRIK